MRRRGGSVPMTFFSFQDVMLSLIGITIVITVVLLLQVTKEASDAIESARTRLDASQPLDERERTLRDTVAALELAISEASRRPSDDPLARRSSLRQELLAASSQLSSLEAESAELLRQLNELLLAHPDAAALRELMELTRRRDELAGKLEVLERVRKIDYIVDERQPSLPIILEISDRRIVVSEVAADGFATRVAAGTLEAQARQALDLYRLLAAGRNCYVFVILKPSGLPLFQTLLRYIQSLPEGERPNFGLDLIAEPSFVSELFPSATTGGAP